MCGTRAAADGWQEEYSSTMVDRLLAFSANPRHTHTCRLSTVMILRRSGATGISTGAVGAVGGISTGVFVEVVIASSKLAAVTTSS